MHPRDAVVGLEQSAAGAGRLLMKRGVSDRQKHAPSPAGARAEMHAPEPTENLENRAAGDGCCGSPCSTYRFLLRRAASPRAPSPIRRADEGSGTEAAPRNVPPTVSAGLLKLPPAPQ